MELLQLRYFMTVSKMGSMTRAASHYHIPQSAMSQSIARLENELGVKLFDRNNNRIYLNDNGRKFQSYVSKALLELQNGIDSISSTSHEISGPVNLLALENRRFVLSCVARFAERYPGVNFSISHDYNGEDDYSYDLCITSNKYHHKNESTSPCIKERILLNLHEKHPLAEYKSIEISRLANERFISMTSRSSLYAITYDCCRAAGFVPTIPFICDDPYFVRKYVSEKMGIALVPEVSWEGRFRENTKLLEIKPAVTTTSYVVWDERKYMTLATKMFKDYLISEALKLPKNLLLSSIK